MRKPSLFHAAAGGVVVLALLCARPVRTGREGKSWISLFWAWQKAEINFINSVTGKPVSMRFGIPWSFSGFKARTDPETEAYYTGGEYSWNTKLAAERRKELRFCSETGIDLRLGPERHEIKNGCLTVELLWPP